ncbi:GTP-binding protein that may be involved in cell development (By similarity) [Musa troglodytarum]|uniref:GTP-binding protein that may be involved in cell development By similarity n=1 Tax=Musa troglodytarum TaxID=320322 RepID=A0A9E7JNL8_9LILI|nr:GTP-binding protein that may be involved in cell development (By similarity) [Musa troglodytarum]
MFSQPKPKRRVVGLRRRWRQLVVEMGEDCAATQLIDANRAFNVDGLDRFLKAVKLADYGLSYAVVSIIGPQSSGKSTLLNHLFGTNFREMDAFKGRSQTTKGIWIAKGVGIEPCTIVLDLEGTDARERGETPLEHLEQVLREDIQQIWDTVYRPQAHEETPLSEFFNGVLQVIDEVSFLLQDFPLAYGRFGKLYEKIRTLTFLLIRYDMETFYFDDGVRTAKRQQLESKALHLVHPAFQAMLGHLRSKALDKFKNDLEQSLESRKGFAMFSTVFSHDKNSMPRVWTGKEDVRKITEEARAVALKFLAAMAAIRLDDQPDKIENILSSSLMDGPVIKDRTIEAFRDPLAASTWEGLSGLLAISTRFLPSVLNILRRVAGEGHRHHQGAQSSQQSLPSAAHAPRNQEPEK